MMNDLRKASYNAGYADGFAGKPKNYYGPYGQWEISNYNSGYVVGANASPPHIKNKKQMPS